MTNPYSANGFVISFITSPKMESQVLYAKSHSVKIFITTFKKTTTYTHLKILLSLPPNYILIVKQAAIKNVLFSRS